MLGWKLFRSKQGLWSGMVPFRSCADGHKQNDLGPVAEPLSARFLTCDRAKRGDFHPRAVVGVRCSSPTAPGRPLVRGV